MNQMVGTNINNSNDIPALGPDQWHNTYPVAKSGTRQSPVDIVSTACTPDNSLEELKYEYSPAIIKIINTGSSWRMDFSSEGSNLSGGPLDDDYKVLKLLTIISSVKNIQDLVKTLNLNKV